MGWHAPGRAMSSRQNDKLRSRRIFRAPNDLRIFSATFHKHILWSISQFNWTCPKKLIPILSNFEKLGSIPIFIIKNKNFWKKNVPSLTSYTYHGRVCWVPHASICVIHDRLPSVQWLKSKATLRATLFIRALMFIPVELKGTLLHSTEASILKKTEY